MTISATYSPDTYAGDGSTTTFAITFNFLSVSTNVKVSIKVNSTGVITTKTAATHYNVSGSNVVFTAGNIPASGETVIIELNPDFKQTSDYAENAALPAETLETDLDERTLESQYLNELTGNSLKIDSSLSGVDTTIVASSTNSSNADKYIKFDSAGTGFEVQTLSATAGLGNVVEDLTPQLGGDLDLNGKGIDFPSTANITDCLDEDNMASDSATALATQQSIKAYADSVAGIASVVADTTPQLGGDLDANGNDIQFDDATGIRDDSDNEQLIFGKTASAVNHVKITNAAAGGEPVIEAVGDDTNVSLELRAQGSGTVSILGNATRPGTLRFYEDTDQGTAYVGLAAPSNTGTPSVTYTLPDGDGNSGDFLQTDGSGVMSWQPQSATTLDWELISSATPSAAASVEFTGLSSTYNAYKIIISNFVPATDAVTLGLTLSQDGGSSYLSSYSFAGDYLNSSNGASTAVANAGSTYLLSEAGAGWGSDTNEQGAVEVTLYNPSGSGFCCVQAIGIYEASNGLGYSFRSGGYANTTGACNAVKILFASGNIESGNIRLYGLRAS